MSVNLSCPAASVRSRALRKRFLNKERHLKKEIYPKYLTNEEIVKYLAKQKSFYLEKEFN